MKTLEFEQFKKQFKPLGFVLGVSIIGFILNLFPLGLFANIHLILGNIGFIIVAMRFGPLYTLFSAVIISTALIYSFGHPFGLIIFGLEAVAISMLRRRGWYVLYADLLYWLIIGMPITAVILFYFTDMPQEFWMMTIVKQAFNGLVCCNVAGLILYFFPKTFAINYRQQPIVKRSFQAQIVYATTQVIILSIVMSSLFISQNLLRTLHDSTENSLLDTKSLIVKQGNDYFKRDILALKTSAHTISLLPELNEQKIKDIIDFDISHSPSFMAVYVADINGDIIASSHNGNAKQRYVNSSIKEQEYFQKSILTNEFHSSKVLLKNIDNTGPVNEMVVHSQSFDYYGDGIIRGSIHAKVDFNRLAQLIPKDVLEKMQYVITDSFGNILFSSTELNLKKQSPFKYTKKTDLTFPNLELVAVKSVADPALKKDEGEDEAVREYFLTESSFDNGWKLHILLDSNIVIETVEREFFFIFALVFLSFLIAISLAQKISSQLTRPLSFIIKQMRLQNISTTIKPKPLPITAATEISTLYNELLKNRQQIFAYQSELELKVEQRTLELQQANLKLTKLAQKDGLTNVYNRRYFDETFSFFQKLSFRNSNTLAVVLLDLDHFKRVNDFHGHLSGDECLRIISEILKDEFCRETDLIARYGGEEFVLVISGISHENLTYKLEKLRKRIEATAIYAEDNKKIHVTASIGAILAEASFALDAQDWIKIADLCLYKAKKSGRNMTLIESFIHLDS